MPKGRCTLIKIGLNGIELPVTEALLCHSAESLWVLLAAAIAASVGGPLGS